MAENSYQCSPTITVQKTGLPDYAVVFEEVGEGALLATSVSQQHKYYTRGGVKTLRKALARGEPVVGWPEGAVLAGTDEKGCEVYTWSPFRPKVSTTVGHAQVKRVPIEEEQFVSLVVCGGKTFTKTYANSRKALGVVAGALGAQQ
ncbi:MAG: hypothetical protein OEQ49_13800 [Myxococcales bacterium]|nr:hypothetical protein [Myxococcales bacterium]